MKFRGSIKFYFKYKISAIFAKYTDVDDESKVVVWQARENMIYNPSKSKRRENSVKGKYAFQV